MKIPRYPEQLDAFLEPEKVLVIYGPRQVGKTTLLNDFLSKTPLTYRLDNGENVLIQEILSSHNFSKIQEYAQSVELIAIDEAQKIPQIGLALKILVDNVPNIKVIATGSSSFELAGQVGEPLTGRKRTLTLFPVAQRELLKLHTPFELQQRLENSLIFGGYPEVLTTENAEKKKQILTEIVSSYLLKDILELERVKSSKILLDLLRLIAFQVGSEVSHSELAQQLGIDYKTVARYLDLCEKAFILYNLRGFSRNLRKEITKKSRYYFLDTGVRNAIIANFNPLHLRDDVGKLWENFCVVERLKHQAYEPIYSNNYFWRTWDQREIDWVEEREGKLFGYEFKWEARNVRTPKEWSTTYPESEFMTIHKENYLSFVS
ncbi:MAG: ATP-binding protein [Candidatus Kerfeldbacteria bacterium]|nr:ATP-binding protein [Candidatus Kerfeldbacteria bacterium]